MIMKPKSSSMSSTEKALKILMAFVPYNHEMGTIEIGKKLDIHKSTVSRLLHLLTEHHFLQQNPETKKYFLGRSVAEIGAAVTNSLNSAVVNIARPYLNDLSDTTGESVALEMLSGNHIILACQVEGQRHIRFSFKPGDQVPINVAAGAKVILAHSEPEFVERCLKQKFVRFTPNTIVSKKAYLNVLEEVRREGIAYDRGERYEDAHAVSAPIFGPEGRPLAGLVVVGPALRMTPEFLKEIIGPLKATAARISERLCQ